MAIYSLNEAFFKKNIVKEDIKNPKKKLKEVDGYALIITTKVDTDFNQGYGYGNIYTGMGYTFTSYTTNCFLTGDSDVLGSRCYNISLNADGVYILLGKANNVYGGDFIELKDDLRHKTLYVNTSEIIGTEYRGNGVEIQIKVMDEDKKSDFYGTPLTFIFNCNLNRAGYIKLFKKWDGKIKYDVDRYRQLNY